MAIRRKNSMHKENLERSLEEHLQIGLAKEMLRTHRWTAGQAPNMVAS